jgi:hypothetical protein
MISGPIIAKTKETNIKGNDMKDASQSTWIRSTGPATTAGMILLGLMLIAGTATTIHAQGQIASGTYSSSGSGPFTYDLTFSNEPNSLSPVGSIWYAWVPGFFYLPGNPIAGSLVAPPGWTATAVLNSIQFVASSSANDILAGHSLSGFSYQANFTPAQLVAAPNSGLSVAYSGGIESGAGFTFTVEHAVIPEPSTLTLLVCGAVGLLLNRRRKLQSA